MKRLFTGGRVVSGSAVVAADVLVDGEKIVSVAPHIDAPDAEVVDVTGKLLLPGFIDAHTHFDLDVCNTTTADDFESGGRSGAAPPPSSTLPAPTRARRWPTAWSCGIKRRQTATVTTAST